MLSLRSAATAAEWLRVRVARMPEPVATWRGVGSGSLEADLVQRCQHVRPRPNRPGRIRLLPLQPVQRANQGTGVDHLPIVEQRLDHPWGGKPRPTVKRSCVAARAGAPHVESRSGTTLARRSLVGTAPARPWGFESLSLRQISLARRYERPAPGSPSPAGKNTSSLPRRTGVVARLTSTNSTRLVAVAISQGSIPSG